MRDNVQRGDHASITGNRMKRVFGGGLRTTESCFGLFHFPVLLSIATVVFLIGFSLFDRVDATELTRAFIDGVRNYENGEYDAAYLEFHKIAEKGIKNSQLFYNLGNVAFKRNQLGLAILWYERALKLNRNDPDIKFNRQHALSLVKDEREDQGITLYRVAFFWKYLLSPLWIRWIAIISNILLWSILLIRFLKAKNKIRFSAGPFFYPILVIAVVTTATALYGYYEAHEFRYAIVISEKLSVRSGLSDNATELFVLHAGSKIRIEDDEKGYYKIYFSEGKIGWIKKENVGVI